ncbi:PqiC family protein [Undibacterium sp. Dicai25W]|uniref:PqiC family protein n=1 Tax=Undibacterium sp. Dicai25W TaxID=3413034 RepID=UPI003BF05690
MIKFNQYSLISHQQLLRKLGVAALVTTLVACASPNKDRFYQLTYANQDHTSDDAKYDVILDTVTIPDGINRPQLVVQKSPTESQILDEQRWVAPLDEQIRQTFLANLQAQLPEAWLALRADTHATLPRYFVHAEIQQLQITPGQDIAIDIVWTISDTNKKPLRRQHLRRSMALNSADYGGIAPAISSVLRSISENMAKDILQATQQRLK